MPDAVFQEYNSHVNGVVVCIALCIPHCKLRFSSTGI